MLRIIAGPGSGKSSVAAHRFGLHRFESADDRAVIGLSFTRAAVRVLGRRITDRWGSAALAWPHDVITVDELHRVIVAHLVASGAVAWQRAPEVGFEVIDAWTEEDGATQMKRDQELWRAGIAITADGPPTVCAVRHWSRRGEKGLAVRARLEEHLVDGRCTHDDVRGIVEDALANQGLRNAVRSWVHSSFRAVIVDEAYDSDRQDVGLLQLFVEAGAAVTLIGDEWQALYAFRGAVPQHLDQVADELGFVDRAISETFRFTPLLHEVAQDLRHGRPVALTELPQALHIDVMLASTWETLWTLGPDVLPLAAGSSPKNVIDAVLTLLLDTLLRRQLHLRATFMGEAERLLGLEQNVEDGPLDAGLGQVLQAVARGQANLENVALEISRWSSPMAARKIRAQLKRRSAHETKQFNRLADRIVSGYADAALRPTPGMTIHQAKGQEWERVAVAVGNSEHEALTTGLSVVSDQHRRLYVGMTRARAYLAVVKAPNAAVRQTAKHHKSGTDANAHTPDATPWFAVHPPRFGPQPTPTTVRSAPAGTTNVSRPKSMSIAEPLFPIW